MLVSGAYIGSDMRKDDEADFLKNVLHVTYNGSVRPSFSNTITGMGTSFDIYTTLNEDHYASTTIDLISPTGKAFCALTNNEGHSVCVAYDGKDSRTFTMGFPFECITSEKNVRLSCEGYWTSCLNKQQSRQKSKRPCLRVPNTAFNLPEHGSLHFKT